MARRARVLLVEDNTDDILQIKRILKSCGLLDDLTIVEDGRDAVNYLAECLKRDSTELPDLIILDLNLPRMSGLEVLQWIRADHRLRDVSVVILTGSREDSSLIELHRLGVLGYLVKPLTSQDFVRTVAGCISLTPSS
ncbi:MAG TPA: response regulator [Planctomycetota bacterium]|nr:response regulator [Planctomycetota bacterium]